MILFSSTFILFSFFQDLNSIYDVTYTVVCCVFPGLSDPTGPCSEGYVCFSGSNSSMPTDGVNGYICPAGSYCPAQSYI